MAKGVRKPRSKEVRGQTTESGASPEIIEPAREVGKAHDRPRRAVTNDEIARRAYEIYQSRGAAHGRALDDWLQAEQELRS
jgi:hypothetical protein